MIEGINAPKTGGTYNYTIVPINSSFDGNVSVVSPVNWVTTSKSDNNITINVLNNTGGERATTLKTKVDGAECSDKTISVEQEGASICTCNELSVESITTQITSNGGQNVTIGYYTGGCLTNIGASTSSPWVTYLSTPDGVVKANISVNASTSSSRSATITVSGRSDVGTCTKTFSITQESSSVTCTCNDLKVSGIDGQINAEAGRNVIVGYYTGGCLTNVTAYTASLLDWMSNITASNGVVKANVSGNTSTSLTRTATIKVSGSTGSGTCVKDISVTQAASAVTCDCNSFELNDYE